ncbi:MAG: methionyl-tRNA formyltransferase [Candidatus Paceibacterota bacterium]|jgi:methionyl-tRNA formyltransferase
MKNLKTIFMGTPEFGAVILRGLIENGLRPDFVVTAPDKPVGREQIQTPPPVKTVAQENGILVLQPEKLKEIIQKTKESEPDLIIVAAYGKLIPKEIIDIPKYGILNAHPSLLPKYRGSAPIQSVILNGDETTGTTIMLIGEKLDSGPILSQKEIEVERRETYKTLHDKLSVLSRDLLILTIPEWISGKIKGQKQDEGKATYCKEIKKEDGEINWQDSALKIDRKIRAFDPWPGAFTSWKGKIIKILKARAYVSPQGKGYPVGKVLIVPQNEIGIQCGKDYLAIEELQLEGKTPVKSEDFIRGHEDFLEATLK